MDEINENVIIDNSSTITVEDTTIQNQPEIMDAVAEEISDSDNLNIVNLGRQLVEKALERNGGNRKKAAAELGISDRTLYRKIKQYGIDKEK